MSVPAHGTGPSRRGVLGALLAAAWVPAAFAAGPSERQLELMARWHAARRRGAPLLALVIPDDDPWERGTVLGGVLGEADPSLLAALSAFEPVCATRTDLHLLGVEVPGTAWFVRVATDAVPAQATWVSVDPGAQAPIDVASAVLRAFLPPAEPSEARVEDGRLRWVTQRIPGSKWAHAGGCGGWVEAEDGSAEDDGIAIGCGMGSMPERAARYLTFAERY
jgi:hypothetical protein